MNGGLENTDAWVSFVVVHADSFFFVYLVIHQRRVLEEFSIIQFPNFQLPLNCPTHLSFYLDIPSRSHRLRSYLPNFTGPYYCA
ncbi:hypothetical protein L1987_47324 [Smallanthus sonchifolius]|uniref:Uncharacterized protein n=1 Tax=Smallanthus sonchifolius TaxID=185202 RepID=A0ACB9G1W0_9ASTR|nr:hypothetical protein L1987_47324 [Smallanthus sonchifolius]